jgi:hypothetical protein
MQDCDKRKGHISSKLHMIYISSNNVRRPVTKTFTTLHYTSLLYTCRHFTTLYSCRSPVRNLPGLLLTLIQHPNNMSQSVQYIACM